MTRKGLTQRIKEKAYALGFDLVGVTTLARSEYGAFFDDWLARGYAGEMIYLSRPDTVTKRRDPRLILGDKCAEHTCSAVVVGLNYYQVEPDAAHAPSVGPTGRVARYAWGDDYHELMWARLHDLASFVEANVGRSVAHQAYVDTGPVFERELAVRAGLGWFGKNTMLINRRLGSWLFLGELLLDLELEIDPPFTADHCGTCTRCIEACPTNCILPERVLDASSCISYLTIELKSREMPSELRPLVGDWLFGCDVCQEVCPWNRFARPTGESAFRPRPGLPTLDLTELLALDDEGFRRRFGASPIKRAKRHGLQRNAAVARGNWETRNAKTKKGAGGMTNENASESF